MHVKKIAFLSDSPLSLYLSFGPPLAVRGHTNFMQVLLYTYMFLKPANSEHGKWHLKKKKIKNVPWKKIYSGIETGKDTIWKVLE